MEMCVPTFGLGEPVASYPLAATFEPTHTHCQTSVNSNANQISFRSNLVCSTSVLWRQSREQGEVLLDSKRW